MIDLSFDKYSVEDAKILVPAFIKAKTKATNKEIQRFTRKLFRKDNWEVRISHGYWNDSFWMCATQGSEIVAQLNTKLKKKYIAKQDERYE